MEVRPPPVYSKGQELRTAENALEYIHISNERMYRDSGDRACEVRDNEGISPTGIEESMTRNIRVSCNATAHH